MGTTCRIIWCALLFHLENPFFAPKLFSHEQIQLWTLTIMFFTGCIMFTFLFLFFFSLALWRPVCFCVWLWGSFAVYSITPVLMLWIPSHFRYACMCVCACIGLYGSMAFIQYSAFKFNNTVQYNSTAHSRDRTWMLQMDFEKLKTALI